MTPPDDALTVEAIVAGTHGTPFDTLGIHPGHDGGQVVRTHQPGAATVEVLRGEAVTSMERRHPAGLFEARFPGDGARFSYRLRVTGADGTVREIDDPYRFPPVLSEEELDGFVRGRDLAMWKRFGAHARAHEGVEGVVFAVWAPSALRVSVVGSFNDWDARRHPMRPRGSTGVWELFVPGVPPGSLYKYEIRTRHEGRRAVKADPVGFATEKPPGTASVVAAAGAFAWGDRDWLETRAARQADGRPVAIYEVHLGSWKRHPGDEESPAGSPHPAERRAENRSEPERRSLTYRELADELVPYAKEMGFTHLELLPVTEHPFEGSWGYQTTGYFAPTARFGSPDDFRHFVDTAHRAGLGVILDWVPGHFPRDAHGLGFFDGTHLYEHPDPRRGLHMDWGTFIFDWGKPEVAAFLLSSALFWIEEFHVDGLRVDAVASMLYLDYSRKPGEWVPNERGGRENLAAVAFLKRLNEVVHERHPGVLTCAEESTSWPKVTGAVADGGLGFDFKWNMGWMNDTLAYAKLDPLARKQHHAKLTFSLTYAFDERFLLPLSHDEVVHLKKSLFSKLEGEDALRFANLRALLGWMYGHPGKKLLFMGAELGQPGEWNHEAELPWELLERAPNRGIREWVRELNELYVRRPELHETESSWSGFEWIDCEDTRRGVFSFVRRGATKGRFLVVVVNFTPVAWKRVRLGVPRAHAYRPILNADESRFGGSGTPLPGSFPVEEVPAHERDQSIELTVPPLGALFLEPRAEPFWSEPGEATARATPRRAAPRSPRDRPSPGPPRARGGAA